MNQDVVECAQEWQRDVGSLEIDFDWSDRGPMILLRGRTEAVKQVRKDIEDIVRNYGLSFETEVSVDVDYECQLTIELISSQTR